jgi:hypothetical protein
VIDQLSTRGFGYGSGLLSPDCSQFIVNMPKNASSFILDWGNHHGWSQAVVGDSCDWHNVKEVIVIVRDPLERWISGVAQYVTGYILSNQGPNGPYFPDSEVAEEYTQYISAEQFISQYNTVVDRLIFDNAVWLDDHVWPQCKIFENLLPDVSRTFIRFGPDLETTLSNKLSWKPIENLDKNQGKQHSDTKKLQEFFSNHLNNRPDLVKRLKNFYRNDYQLIEKAFNE